MKFLNFLHGDGVRLGAVIADTHILDLTAAWPVQPAPASVDELIAGGDAAVALAQQAIQTAGDALASGNTASTVLYASATILPPVALTGRNIFNVGRNYREHIIEGNLANGRPADAFPQAIEFFTKPRTALVGHRGCVLRHGQLTNSLDYEVELAIVIGKGGRDIPVEKAHEYVFGYTILNDVTARDLQRLHGQWFKGKSLDTSCPLGPVVAHASAVENPDNLNLVLEVDGEERQNDNTNSMIFNVATVIAQLSAGMTLLPGDVIATGTPKGVGFAQRPQRCLQVGQTVRARIEGIGELTNTVVA
ncbi:fumarylacetoacetate hydrolase family protein [Acidovorax sp. sif1233]|uniref:fumarylacetoacetate hydrolase family protein n=1 Tax=unclassified Acidovorax TaxID=2684926 RepID=UPI001C495DD6|nr:fumarylacetoacetate hydrolase family protein [Acidovorax sp. sif1233]MBV7455138.1 fumarylacetoacetate hydrolase family protein [Acidovorax sp. sif1233]